MAVDSHPAPVPARNGLTAPNTRLVCLFHLNLAFSSLEEHAHAEIVRRCYWPLVELAAAGDFPLAIEATGWTLQRIAALDPDWIERARVLLADKRLELIGSAHAQCAAPLLPAAVNAWNLRLGRELYAELLGVSPRIALVCEQVWSPGLVALYRDAGYEAVIVDWDNAYRSHHDWPRERRHHPQRARGGGTSIPVVWSESLIFQKFQRYAHGELSLERYLEHIRDACSPAIGTSSDPDPDLDAGTGTGVSACTGTAADIGAGALLLYANDAEVFDHRPGRFAAEPELQEGEWQRIGAALRALVAEHVGTPALPSDVLDLLDTDAAGHELTLEAPSQPIPVKKQDKYNVARWAVSGRDDIGVNTRCWRIYERMCARSCDDPAAWRELCELWASDFRTHITDARWAAFQQRLGAAESLWLAPVRPVGATSPDGLMSPSLAVPPAPVTPLDSLTSPARAAPVAEAMSATRLDDSFTELTAGPLTLRLNTRRGLAIAAFTDARVSDRSLLGTLEHGYFPTIDLGADFYSGHLVQESPLSHKITDLEHVLPRIATDAHGRVCALATIPTELGPIEKTVRLDPCASAIELEWSLGWSELPVGSLRFGHVTLAPEAFDLNTLWYATHNGGTTLDLHRVGGPKFDHGASVSALVSCGQGLGLTEGVVLLGDARRTIRVEVDQACARPLGLVSWDPGALLASNISSTMEGELASDAGQPCDALRGSHAGQPSDALRDSHAGQPSDVLRDSHAGQPSDAGRPARAPRASGGERWFLRLSFSLTESDETRRGAIARERSAPQQARLRISAAPTPVGWLDSGVPDYQIDIGEKLESGDTAPSWERE
ncbi:MAG TPA: hypothetical protein VLJ42_11905 [Solirubrobacteraceae bacterium]|nr:hypothetical protein [Solirubrobacteraceae bacterium]